MICVVGRLSEKDGELKIIAEKIKEVTKKMLDDLLIKEKLNDII